MINFKKRDVPEPPPAPLTRIIRDGCWPMCKKCGSSTQRRSLFGAKFCINPQCGCEYGK